MAVIHTGVTKKDLKGGNTEENREIQSFLNRLKIRVSKGNEEVRDGCC